MEKLEIVLQCIKIIGMIFGTIILLQIVVLEWQQVELLNKIISSL